MSPTTTRLRLYLAANGRMKANSMTCRFLPDTLETALLYNNQTKRRAYYAFPLKQFMMHAKYWGDVLEASGFRDADIPTAWRDYWAFWCDKVQPDYRKVTGKRIYG